MQLIFIGTISGTHGKNGALQFEPSPDAPETLPEGTPLRIGFSSSFAKTFTLTSWQHSPTRVIFSVKEFSTPEAANVLFDQGVFIEESLAQKVYREEFTQSDILGCKVIDEISGSVYGTISDIWKMPANDVWVITSASGEFSIPVVDEFVRRVDIPQKIVYVTLPEGFTEPEEE